jgi:hypothetical protein
MRNNTRQGPPSPCPTIAYVLCKMPIYGCKNAYLWMQNAYLWMQKYLLTFMDVRMHACMHYCVAHLPVRGHAATLLEGFRV